jgi:hypothetical protein
MEFFLKVNVNISTGDDNDTNDPPAAATRGGCCR